MRTLGVDLASDPRRTGICVVGWQRGAASVDELALAAARDNAFDALIAALIARAAVTGRTIHPTSDERAAARTEGWIHVPHEGSLERLHRGARATSIC